MPLYNPGVNRVCKRLNFDLTTTASLVLPANPLRESAILVNDSDSTAYIGKGEKPASNQGIRLNASGGSYEITSDNPWFGDVYAISTGATKRICIEEVSIRAT
jgi:hypothetical protein